MLVLSIAALAATLPRPAWACTCIARSTTEHFDAATVVFTGSVSAVETGVDEVEVTLAALGLYKGEVAPVQPVRTPADSAGCGVAFVPGARYTVFATRGTEGLRTDLCSGTQAGVTALADAGFVAVRLFTAPASSTTPSTGPVAVVPTNVGEGDERAGPIAAAAILLAVVGAVIVHRRIRPARGGGALPPTQ